MDAQFIGDDTYIALSLAGCGNDAYLFLLALAGQSRVNQSDGRLRLSTVAEIGRRMRLKTNRILDALIKESMVVITNDELVLQKQAKWQTSKAEVEQLQGERAKAGAKGGKQNASKRVANVEQTGRGPEPDAEAKPSRDREEIEIEQEIETESSNEDMSLARELVAVLTKAIELNGSKPPNTRGWEVEADRMLRLDGRTPEEAASLILWCQDDPFWKANILSMAKFRQQYDKLRLQRDRAAAPTTRTGKAIAAGRQWAGIADDLKEAGL